MAKPRRVLGGALLTAAATALAVKATLTAPIGTAVKADELQHDLGAAKDATIGQSRMALVQAQQRLAGASLRVPSSEPAATASQAPATGTLAPHHPERDRLDAHQLLYEAALRHQLDPKLVLAVSYWESGWDQSRVSQSGAVGLMQVEPATAQAAGPALLGRAVDITNAYDNADVGTAVLKENLDTFKDLTMGLAAYYQGPTSLRANGMLPDTQQYVQGILDLAARMNP
jgi:soluble lytic murein transglycosylase-like protein